MDEKTAVDRQRGSRAHTIDFSVVERYPGPSRGRPYGPTHQGDWTREVMELAYHCKRWLIEQGMRKNVNIEAARQTSKYVCSPECLRDRGWTWKGGNKKDPEKTIHDYLKLGRYMPPWYRRYLDARRSKSR